MEYHSRLVERWTAFLILFTMTTLGEVQIHDYTGGHMVTIHAGLAKIQNGYFKFIHVLNVEQYEQYILETRNLVNEHIPPDNTFFPLLNHELSQSYDLLDTLKPTKQLRNKRAFNFLGTAWKYVAGSPDHDDLELINKTLDELISNNNQQVFINKNFEDQINRITKISNEFTNYLRKDNILIDEIVINLQNRIRMVKEEIINIKYAIQWAKTGVINSLLLDKNEVKNTLEKLDKQKIPFDTAEEALEFSNVKVLTNGTRILYVVKVPLTSNEIYEKLILKPIKSNDTIVKIEFENVLRNENEIYGIKIECKEYNSVTICNQENVVEISRDTCVAPLIKGRNSSCIISNAHHIPSCEEIEPGILFLNDFNGSISAGKINHTLHGTFLIKFYNETIDIGGKQFRNLEAPPLEAMPAILQPTPLEESRIKLLSLEVLSELHIRNMNAIRSLKSETIVTRITSSITILGILFLGAVALKFSRRKVKVVMNPLPESISERQPKATTPSVPSLHNIPYF